MASEKTNIITGTNYTGKSRCRVNDTEKEKSTLEDLDIELMIMEI